MADTVAAGTGGVQFTTHTGHFGRPAPGRPTYGQVVHVDRLAGGLPDSVGAAVRQAGGRVVLVPWDYAADCGPVPWARSARWMPVAARGFFEGRLRDRAHWVAGVPTLDVFAPQFVPYTGAAVAPYQAPVATAGPPAPDWLAPDELLDVRALLPPDTVVTTAPERAFARLRAWGAANPALAARSPARELLQRADQITADVAFSRRPVPLAGTYRVTVRLAGADSSTFYVRTESRPTGSAARARTLAGMYVLACAMPTERDLPLARPPGGCGQPYGAGAEGYFAFGDSVWTDAAGRRVRAGDVDIAHGDSAFQARFHALTWERARTMGDGNPRHFLPGEFAEAPEGRVTFEWRFSSAGRPVVHISAERVSPVVMRRADARP